jgi:hypothetical protein
MKGHARDLSANGHRFEPKKTQSFFGDRKNTEGEAQSFAKLTIKNVKALLEAKNCAHSGDSARLRGSRIMRDAA